MKRLHVHVSVTSLPESIHFYSGLFATAPIVKQHDYAKWILDDPPVNFAISTHAAVVGVNHLGIQVESAQELAQIEQRADISGISTRPELGANCCYARSDKRWLDDPQGVAWEVFQSLGSTEAFRDTGSRDDDSACCAAVQFASSSNTRSVACGAGVGCC